MKGVLTATWVGSLAALGVATCCVLPMALMLVGLGGSWLAVFGTIASASYPVLAVSSALVLLSGILWYRRGPSRRAGGWLAGAAVLTLLAWVVLLTEARLNEYLITWM